MDAVRYRQVESRLWASLDAAPTEQWVRLRTADALVRVQEVGAGPPILFLHGGSVCGTCWAPLVARLAGFRCLVPDRPGCGLSDPLAEGLADIGRLQRFADELVADVLDALEIERAYVAATSFGGYMALRSAAAHVDRFSGLLLLGFPVGAPVGRTPFVMRFGGAPGTSQLMGAIPPTPRMVQTILKGIGLRDALENGQITPEMLDWFLSMLRDTDTMRNETGSLPRIMTLWKGMNDSVLLTDDLLERVVTPTHLLWGEHDPFGGADTARAFTARFPDADLELVAAAGHAPWMDDTTRAAEFVRRAVSN